MGTVKTTCMFSGEWSVDIPTCEPVVCWKDPPAVPSGAKSQIILRTNSEHLKQYLTKIQYDCPANTSLPISISSNHTFDYVAIRPNAPLEYVQTIIATCEIDGYYQIRKKTL